MVRRSSTYYRSIHSSYIRFLPFHRNYRLRTYLTKEIKRDYYFSEVNNLIPIESVVINKIDYGLCIFIV